MLASLFTKPGDCGARILVHTHLIVPLASLCPAVVVEEPTYFLGRALLEDHGVTVHTVPVTADGLDVRYARCVRVCVSVCMRYACMYAAR